MKFSSRDIEQLADKSVTEIHELTTKAEIKFTAPEKLMLNLIKLLMLIPPFFFVARQELLWFLIALASSLLVYLFLYTPVRLKFISKYLK